MLCLLTLALAPLQATADDPSAPSSTTIPAEPVVVPLRQQNGWPIVDVVLNGQGPFPMILDTGAMGLVLNADLARELDLPHLGTTRIGDPTNPSAIEVDLVQVDSIGLGEARFGALEAIGWERPEVLQRHDVRGVLGLAVFADCLFTLDLPRGELTLARGALPEPDGERVIAFTRDDFGAITLPVHVEGRVVDAHLDSGNARSLVLPGELENALPLVPGTKRRGRAMRASGPVEFVGATLDGTARIGGIVLERPEVRFDSSLGHGNVGSDFLRQCAVTVDLANRRMRLETREPIATNAPGPRAAGDGGPRRRLGVELGLGSQGVEVLSVQPGSAAEHAGLRVGDVLTAVDGAALHPTDMSPLQEALAGPAAFTLTVERTGEAHELEVPAAGEPGERSGPGESGARASEDARLDALLGDYVIEARTFPSDGGAPRTLEGTATFERAHDGRFVRESFTLDAGGRALRGEAWIAWRPRAGRYELTQIDAFNPTTFWLTGHWDPERERLALRSVTAAQDGPHDEPLRWEYRFEKDGVFVKEMLRPDGAGGWRLASDYRYVPVTD